MQESLAKARAAGINGDDDHALWKFVEAEIDRAPKAVQQAYLLEEVTRHLARVQALDPVMFAAFARDMMAGRDTEAIESLRIMEANFRGAEGER